MKLTYSFAFIGLLMFSESGLAQSLWTAIDEVDPFTDEGIKAVVYEDETHRIQISKETEDNIAMYLVLKRGTSEPNTTLQLRVDKNPMVESKPMGKMLDEILIETIGMTSYRWTPSTLVVLFASISILNATSPKDMERATSSCQGRMTQFLNGDRLIGRYHVSDTSRQTLSVSLEGFKPAANQVFDIAEMHNANPHCLR